MSDTTKDIDGLLGYLSIAADRYSCHTIPIDVAAIYHAALTALVADRDALLAWRSEMSATHAHLGKSYTMLAEECSELKQRVADLVADNRALSYNNEKLHGLLKSHPPADRDRDLRERDKAMERWMDQVTAMLCHSMTHSHDAKQQLVTRCDAAIAAMRKEGGGDAN